MINAIATQLSNISTSLLPASEATGMVGLLQKLNPVGGLFDAYNRTLEYRAESKRIEAELERMREQAKLAHAYLNNTLKEHIAALECRQAELKSCLQAYGNEQNDRRQNRLELMQHRANTVNAMLSPDLAIEHKQLLVQMVCEIGKQIADVDNKAQQSLDSMLQTLSQPAQLPSATPFFNWQKQGE